MEQSTQQQFFGEIIEQHKGILLRVARIYCPHHDDRQDLIQEIMIQIWQSLHKYNNQFKMSTFLYRIALNVAITFFRKNTRRRNLHHTLDDQVLLISADTGPGKEQQLNYLEKFINELKEIDKALMLLYLEDKSHAEIAEIMGISVSNVGTRIGRIKERIKARFSQLK